MNDDYIHGLQVAYKAIFDLQQKCTGVEAQVLQHGLRNINREIDKACAGNVKKKIILLS